MVHDTDRDTRGWSPPLQMKFRRNIKVPGSLGIDIPSAWKDMARDRVPAKGGRGRGEDGKSSPWSHTAARPMPSA